MHCSAACPASFHPRTTCFIAQRRRYYLCPLSRKRLTLFFITENIFKVASSSGQPRQQENLRPRGQNRSSNPTERSTSSEVDALYDATFIRPLRQPLDPPYPTLIQKHAGFARFLKQHASPPHHRVTAGGRIVPAGPLSPPPFQLLPSINAVVTNPHSKSLVGKFETDLPETSTKEGKKPKTLAGASARPLAQQNVNVSGPKPFDFVNPVSVLNNVASARDPHMQVPLINQFGVNLGPLPLGAQQIGFSPDGSPFVYFNGVNYQCYWDGNSTILKPLQLSTPTISQMGYNTSAYPQMPLGTQYHHPYTPYGASLGLPYPQDTIASQQFMDGINDAQDQSQQLNMPQLGQPFNLTQSGDPPILHEQLASRLTTLDKYVALHLHEFSPAENARCFGLRRQLVEQLDILRMSKETNSLLNSTDGAAYSSHAGPPQSAPTVSLEASNLSNSCNTQCKDQGVLPTTPVASGPILGRNHSGRLVPTAPKLSKCLSPDAPPFVPAGAKAILLNRVEISKRVSSNNGQGLERQGGSTYHNASTGQPITRHSGNEHTAEQVLDKVPTESGGGRSKSDATILGSSPKIGPNDALPVVTMSEIEYASAPGFNPPEGPKLYCTTPGDFQEVIRRVREQAQMYGCKGGQSKDPAYDAEQDIRWAMADGEPIPLPRSPADHVANPRSWTWDDSAFNYRRDLAITSMWANKSNQHLTYQQPRTSVVNGVRFHSDDRDDDPRMVGSEKLTSRMIKGEPAGRSRDLTHSSSAQKQSLSHDRSGIDHSSTQPNLIRPGDTSDGGTSSKVDRATTWTINNAQLLPLASQNTSPNNSLAGARTSNQGRSDQDAPQTPVKSRNHSAYSATISPRWRDINAQYTSSPVRPGDVQKTETDALSFDSQGIAYSASGIEAALYGTCYSELYKRGC